MSLLVTGSIGIDTVETPHGKVQDVLGGSAIYFSLAASLFGPVRLVGVVGEDFPEKYLDVFKGRPVDMAGLESRKGSKTFRWHGRYEGDMNSAESVKTDLNVLGEQGPKIPASFVDSKVVFLANTHPALQRELLGKLKSPELVIADTMNLWIETARDELIKTLSVVHGVVLNDGEARLLTGKKHLMEAGRGGGEMGAGVVVDKKGEHGSVLVTRDDSCVLPAYPTGHVIDPTGAGDSFAGGMLGYLASTGTRDGEALRSAIARGTVTASFTIEGFSFTGLVQANRGLIDQRLSELHRMVHFH